MIDKICFKVPVSFSKISITYYISHLISFIIYAFILNFFIKVYIIIKDKKMPIIYIFIQLFKNSITIRIKSPKNNFISF